jgi:eukaryotic-like serine/threonine-protein kinase
MPEPSTVAGPRTIGRYALYAQIAAGGMAAVHLGRLLGQAGFSRTVAIKRLHPHLAQDPEFVSMLLDEARLAARIRHPNVVSTLDVVALEGELLVVMEYVHGEALSRVLSKLRRKQARVPPNIAAAIIASVLYGLHAAHDATSETGEPLNIIHRDVSPQNIMVGADGVARVVDFGVAKAAGRLQETREGQLKGKIRYMAPEQLKRGEVDRAADIYAASVVLWECLTSQRLFDDENEWKIAHAIVEGVTDPPSRLAPEVPAALDDVVMRGLAVDRAKRFRTAFDMAAALEDAIAPATPRQIASWLEGVAADTLRERAAQLASVEGQSKSLVSAAALELTSSPSASSSPFGPPSSKRKGPEEPPAAETSTETAPAGSELSNLSNVTTAHYDRVSADRVSAAPAQQNEVSEPSHTAAGTAASFFPPPAPRQRLASAGPTLLTSAAAAVTVFVLGIGIYWLAGSLRQTEPAAPAAAQPPSAEPVQSATVAEAEEPSAAPEPSSAEPEASASAPEPEVRAAASAAPPAITAHPARTKFGLTHSSGKVPGGATLGQKQCNPPYYFDKDGVKHFKPECL